MGHETSFVPVPRRRMRYLTRPHAGAPEQTWALAGPLICVGDGRGLPQAVPLAEVIALRLDYAPTRPEPDRYRCTLTRREGGELVFFNRTVPGALDFTDTSADYVAFVRALHAVLARESPQCRFLGGATPGAYALNWAATLLTAGVVLVASLFLAFNGLAWLILLKLGLLAIFAPNLFHGLARNRPCAYDPAAIPPRLLPGTGG